MSTVQPAGFWRTLVYIFRKDMLLEWRGRTRINATLFFGLLTLLLFSFAAGPDHAVLARNAPGYVWLAVLLGSVLSLGESLRLESENNALEGLRLVPVNAAGLFLGKALANTALLSGLALVLVPLSVVLYDASMVLPFATLLPIVILGAAAISAPGTLYAAIANQARARDVLLPLLLFPILIPGLLASVKATALVFFGDPMQQLSSWMGLLAAFNAMYWPVCSLLFGRVIEE